jgi:RNA polymerase sigma-70 factor (ECF subfamily)
MSHSESTVLLRQARAGSPEALDELYRRYSGRLLALIRLRMGRQLRARLDSRDILQATLLKSFQHLEAFAGSDGVSLMAWLGRIAENEIRDQADYQHRQRRDVAASVPIDDVQVELAARMKSAFSQLALSEEAERLEQALESLEPDHREVIVLRKFEELGFKDIAARMGRSEDACRMLLARAMAALTLRLGVTGT